MHLNHPETIPAPRHLPIRGKIVFRETFLVPKRLGTAALGDSEATVSSLILLMFAFPMLSRVSCT